MILNPKFKIENRQSPNQQITRSPDSRHRPLMEEIDRLYREYNEGLPPPDMGHTAKALSEFLRGNPKWPLKTLQRAMRNRFFSKGVNWSESPWRWIKYLPDYALDPLNEFRQPMRGKGNEVFAYWEQRVTQGSSAAAEPAALRGNSEL